MILLQRKMSIMQLVCMQEALVSTQQPVRLRK